MAALSLLDGIVLQRQWSYNPVKLQEQATGVTKRLALGIASPERCSLGEAIGALVRFHIRVKLIVLGSTWLSRA